MEQHDPSLMDGHKVLYERKVPFELRIKEVDVIEKIGQEVGSREEIRVKLLYLGDAQDPENIKVELFSEHDYFFYYCHDVTPQIFSMMQKE